MLVNAWIVMGKTVHAVRSCSRLAENPLGANNTVVVVAIIYLGFAGIVLFFLSIACFVCKTVTWE